MLKDKFPQKNSQSEPFFLPFKLSLQESKAIAAMSQLNTIIPLIMAAAPLLGGYLNAAFGFRSNFLVIALFVLISLAICLFFYEESLPKEKRAPLQAKKLLNDFKLVLTSVAFWQLILVCSFIFAGYLAFLSATAVLFVIEFSVSKALFPLYQGAILAAWVIGSLTCSRALKKWGNFKLKMVGAGLILCGGLGLIAGSFVAPQSANLCTFFMLFFTFGANWTCGLYFPEAMELFPDIKGIAASIMFRTTQPCSFFVKNDKKMNVFL